MFDLLKYLWIQGVENKSEKTWKCPVCKKKAIKLYIDGYVKKIIENNPQYNDVSIYNKDFKFQFQEIDDTKIVVETATILADTGTQKLENKVVSLNEPRNTIRPVFSNTGRNEKDRNKSSEVICLDDDDDDQINLSDTINLNNNAINLTGTFIKPTNLSVSDTMDIDIEDYNKILALNSIF